MWRRPGRLTGPRLFLATPQVVPQGAGKALGGPRLARFRGGSGGPGVFFFFNRHDRDPDWRENGGKQTPRALDMPGIPWHKRPASSARTAPPRRCGSSVVEHSIGNGEVESSILSRSTRNPRSLPRCPPYGATHSMGRM